MVSVSGALLSTTLPFIHVFCSVSAAGCVLPISSRPIGSMCETISSAMTTTAQLVPGVIVPPCAMAAVAL